MMWRKDVHFHNRRSMDFLLLIILALAILGLIMKQPFIYLLTGLIGAYFLITILYDRYVGNRLELRNERMTIKLFPEEEGHIVFEFQNKSFIPMINGEFRFRSNRNIRFTKHPSPADKYWRIIDVPLSITGRKKIKLALPFIAEDRGIAKISNINYSFPHLLQFQNMRIDYNAPYLLEIVVFPKFLPVQRLEIAFQNQGGSQRVPFSPMEDLLVPLGTREYSYSDPFHRINWKATAKTQKMQTNVYERVIDMSFLFIVNIGAFYGMRHESATDYEDYLSYAAFLTKYAAEKEFPYELYINSRKPGKTPYMHLPEGEGRNHYAHALEMLARIPHEAMVVPFEHMLYRIGQQLHTSKTIILIGELTSEAKEIVDNWGKHHRVLQLEIQNNQAVLTPRKRGRINAK